MKLRSQTKAIERTVKNLKRSRSTSPDLVKIEQVDVTVVKEEVDADIDISLSSLSSLTSYSSHLDDSLELSLSSIVSKDIKDEKPSKVKSKTKVKSVKQSKKKVTKDFQPIAPPDNWKEVFLKIEEYRKTHLAPVDSMGCERTDNPSLTPQEFRFHVLVSLMLSSQTKDEITHAAVKLIKKAGNGKVTAETIDSMDTEVFHDCIRKVGFHNAKTKFVKQAARICVEKYDGDIPPTVTDLMAIPGIGPKMAFLAMQCAWDINCGIGVDVHVHRITNRLGWVKTTDPEATRLSLESWLPQEWWKAINFLLVGFGQTLCYSARPRCFACPIADACPSRDLKSTPSRKSGPIRSHVIPGSPKITLEYEED